jgi:hypothetical protein
MEHVYTQLIHIQFRLSLFVSLLQYNSTLYLHKSLPPPRPCTAETEAEFLDVIGTIHRHLHRVHIFTRDETESVYLPTQLERTLQLYW